jgi:hypothetical protein
MPLLAGFALPHAPNKAAGTGGGREWFTVPGRERPAAGRAEGRAADAGASWDKAH